MLQDGLYGVYSEVAKLRTWIDETIAANGGASYCQDTSIQILLGK